ncbi:hypothetical protein [uncultured Stenotrophomonas sp.]|uniref:hypothetical protein n=1 Tax=uncultured Stenotrophomonas sp. TaxID=165438 RepID=UPI0025E599D7|nr:hypothetical protein [uncultured Stenotrophomonas sp.]
MNLPAGAEHLRCGNCGGDSIRTRVRTGPAANTSAQIVCQQCGARGALHSGPDARRDAVMEWQRQPPIVAGRLKPTEGSSAPFSGMTGPTTRSGDRDPLELLARMLVGGNYRVPDAGRATVPTLTPADVAGAVGMMRNPVAKQAAMAVALRAEGDALLRLGRSAARRLLRACRQVGPAQPLRIDEPADRWRMRLVLQDAVNDLVWPERKRSSQVAAKAAKMRKGDYLQVHRLATAVLNEAVEEGRKEFRIRLFAR